MKIKMNTTVPVLSILLATLVQTILAHPVQSEWEYTTNDCPPGIWVCRKKRAEVPKPEESNDCPPGIWTCQKKRSNVVKPETLNTDVADADCPPGIWTCKKHALQSAKEMALNAAQDVDARRREIVKRMMQQRAKETARMLNAARMQNSNSQMKRSNECPPGIWVC